MAGYIEKTPPTRNFPRGGWKATYRDPSGKERSKTFGRRTDADTFLAATKTDKARGNWVDPMAGKVTFDAYWAEWSAGVVLAPSTRDSYGYLYKHHLKPTFGAMELGRITLAEVKKWRVGLLAAGKVSANTTAKAYRLLARVMGSAVEEGRIAKTPCTVKKAGVERIPEMQVITAAQVHALSDVVGMTNQDPRQHSRRYRAMVLVAAYGGLRWGELCGLRRSKVDPLHGTVKVAAGGVLHEVNGHLSFGDPKTEAGLRTVTIPATVMEELTRHLMEFSEPGPDGLVFPAPEGGPMRRSNFRRRVWVPATKRVGVPALRWHDLRHTAGTFAAAVPGTSTADHMARLGHASPRAALIYQHATKDAENAIAAALDALAASTRPEAPTPLRRSGTDPS